MTKRILQCVYLATALLMLLSALVPAHAQVLYGSIVGTVEDPSGSVVPKAAVTVVSKESGSSREAVADDAGRFTILNVLPGTYDMKVMAPGFRTFSRPDVVVAVNSVMRADARARGRNGDRTGDRIGPDRRSANR